MGRNYYDRKRRRMVFWRFTTGGILPCCQASKYSVHMIVVAVAFLLWSTTTVWHILSVTTTSTVSLDNTHITIPPPPSSPSPSPSPPPTTFGVDGTLFSDEHKHMIPIPKDKEEVVVVIEKKTTTTIATIATNTEGKPTLVIIGTIQNAEPHLPKLHHAIQRAVQGFHVKALLFYENDSTDNTLAILQTWKQSTWPTLTIMSETNVTLHERTDRLANGRNKLLHEMVRLDYVNTVDYVLMMDMDEVNYHISHLDECLHLPTGFGACCANQYTMYYDLWALRAMDRSWVDYDIWTAGLNMNALGLLFRHIPASAKPIPVHSCFGGAALYNASYLVGLPLDKVNYTGTILNSNATRASKKLMRVCEHVPFHLGIRTSRPDFQMFIQPKFLNNGPLSWDKAGNKGAARLRAEWKQSMKDPSMSKYYESMKNS